MKKNGIFLWLIQIRFRTRERETKTKWRKKWATMLSFYYYDDMITNFMVLTMFSFFNKNIRI